MKTPVRYVSVVLFVSTVLLASAADLFAPDRFTPFNIIPSSIGKEEVAAADAIEYEQLTGNSLVLYSLTLHPEGNPAMAKVDRAVESYRKFVGALAGSRVKPGVLLQAILGHWPRVDKKVEPWQRTVNIDGELVRFCPLDEKYRAYIREVAVKLAKEHPFVILGDDDIRSFSPKAECFCPLHTAKYNRLAGKDLTPEEFRKYIKSLSCSDADHQLFVEMQRDTIKGVCALIREGIDSVDPSIFGGVCMPGWAWERSRVSEYAKVIAAKEQRPFVRLANGQYHENSPKVDLSGNVLETQSMIQRLGSGAWLLDEADTYPHNPYSKAAVSMHAKLVAGAFCGLKGAKLWYVNCHKEGRPISKNYTRILTEHRGYYDAVAKLSSESTPTGVIVPCHSIFPSTPVGDLRCILDTDSNGWAQKAFGVFGVPYRCEHELGTDGIYAIAGQEAVARFTDDELKAMLSRRVLIDGDATVALAKRGYSSLIGVNIRKDAQQYTHEYEEQGGDMIYVPMTSKVPLFSACERAKTLTTLIWRESAAASDFQRVAPAATLYRNQLGGTVVAVAYHMHMGAAYCYSEGRRDWLARRLCDLADGKMENLAHGAQNTLILTRKGKAGDDLVCYFNLNYDPAASIRIDRSKKPMHVETLGNNGSWKTAKWQWKDGVLDIFEVLPCYCEKIISIH